MDSCIIGDSSSQRFPQPSRENSQFLFFIIAIDFFFILRSASAPRQASNEEPFPTAYDHAPAQFAERQPEAHRGHTNPKVTDLSSRLKLFKYNL